MHIEDMLDVRNKPRSPSYLEVSDFRFDPSWYGKMHNWMFLSDDKDAADVSVLSRRLERDWNVVVIEPDGDNSLLSRWSVECKSGKRDMVSMKFMLIEGRLPNDTMENLQLKKINWDFVDKCVCGNCLKSRFVRRSTFCRVFVFCAFLLFLPYVHRVSRSRIKWMEFYTIFTGTSKSTKPQMRYVRTHCFTQNIAALKATVPKMHTIISSKISAFFFRTL
jgi:hypothetical protein